MISTEFKVKETTYELRLNLKGVVKFEKITNKHPLDILINMENGKMPDTEDLVHLIHLALQPAHSAQFSTIDSVYDLLDSWLEDNNSLMGLIEVITHLYTDSGIIPKVKEESANPN